MDSLDYSLTGFKRSDIMLTPWAKYQFFSLICVNFQPHPFLRYPAKQRNQEIPSFHALKSWISLPTDTKHVNIIGLQNAHISSTETG